MSTKVKLVAGFMGEAEDARQKPVDLSSLPEEFDASDFDVVFKELWLQGFWLKETNPGRADVYVESGSYGGEPICVTYYRKNWNESVWKLAYR